MRYHWQLPISTTQLQEYLLKQLYWLECMQFLSTKKKLNCFAQNTDEWDLKERRCIHFRGGMPGRTLSFSVFIPGNLSHWCNEKAFLPTDYNTTALLQLACGLGLNSLRRYHTPLHICGTHFGLSPSLINTSLTQEELRAGVYFWDVLTSGLIGLVLTMMLVW